MSFRTWLTGSLALTLVISGCSRAPLQKREDALRRVDPPVELLQDDLPIAPLLDSVQAQIAFLQAQMPSTGIFRFGKREFPRDAYLAGLARFVELGRQAKSPEEFRAAVVREFDFYEVYGQEDWGDVFITSYYEPVIEGSLKRTERFTQPLYSVPPDLVAVDLTVFNEKFAGERKYRARVENGKLVPYFSRQQIDSWGVLNGKKLELCWVDPIDAFFLQIQGSGTVDLGKGKQLRINYADKNGHPYVAIGKALTSVIPISKMTLHSMETYLKTLKPDALQAILNQNPSYVFFRLAETNAVTSLGVPATAGRTIATDGRYFPKGALGFLVADQPEFESPEALEPKGWKPLRRFILDQDVGGAIVGGGRLDLFWGRGAEAKQHAGVMKQRGRLFYLAPKEGS